MVRAFTSVLPKTLTGPKRRQFRFRPALEFLEGRTVPATHFVMDLTTATAGTAATVHVTAVNDNGTTDTGYLGQIEFRSSDTRAILPAAHQALASGTGSFSVTFLTAGTDTLVVQDMDVSSITGQSSIAVSPAATAQFGVTGFASQPTAGSSGAVTVTAQDQYGNRTPGYAGTVHFTSSDLQAVLPGDTTLTSGQQTFNVTFKTAGTQTLVATDVATSAITGDLHAQPQNVAVYSQAPDPLGGYDKSSWCPPNGLDGDQYVWDRFLVNANETINEIHWRGAYYNQALYGAGESPVADFTITIWANSPFPGVNEPAILSQPIATYTVGGNANETAVGIIGGVPMYDYQFTLATPFQAVAGTPYWVQIEASQGLSPFPAYFPPDWSLAYGTGGDSSHFREIIGGTGGGGNAFQQISHDTAFSLFSSSNGAGVVVNPGATAQFVVTGYPTSIHAGTLGSLAVTAEDAFGNLTTNYTGTVHFTSSDAAAVLPGDSTLTAGTGTFDATFNTGGLQSISATDTVATTITGSQTEIAVLQAPGITSADHATFVVGGAATFQITTSGYPAPILSLAGTLPSGVTFTDNGNGTASVTGTAAAGMVGNYSTTVTAHNDSGSDATQPFTLTISKAATSTTIASASAPSVFGQPVTITATIHPAVPGITSASGNVTFFDGVTPLGTSPVVNGVATFASSNLARGSHSITAVFDGDPNLLGSTSVALTQKVKTVALVPDPRNSARQDLLIGGTDGNDVITVTGGPVLTVEVKQTSGGSLHLIATYSPSSIAEMVLFGGGGNDVLKVVGATPTAFLFGGEGNDTLRAGSGRALLVGGAGADKLFGGSANTLLIGGITDYDSDLAALASLRAEWARTDLGYQARADHLLGPAAGGTTGGKNNQYYLNPTTVHDDATADTLTGGSANDWFFSDKLGLDSIIKQKPNERVTPV